MATWPNISVPGKVSLAALTYGVSIPARGESGHGCRRRARDCGSRRNDFPSWQGRTVPLNHDGMQTASELRKRRIRHEMGVLASTSTPVV